MSRTDPHDGLFGGDGSAPEPGPERRVLTVREVNDEISAAVSRAFPATVWVRGEVQRLPSDAARRTHVYFELHETGRSGAAEYQVPVSLMGWDRQRFGLGRFLDGSDPDVQLANKLEVCLECKVDYYAKFGKLSLKVVGVDRTFALGRLEAQRRETLAYLEAAGLTARNASMPLPDLPLRVGLVTSPGSAAEQDFRTGLAASPWAFTVEMVGAKMQGEQLQGEVVRALRRLAEADVDVIVLTRGGGSRADLSWFDQKDLAEAIARCPLPVVTAIGHEIDRSIADVVAHRSCKTPTAAAEFLVDTVAEQAARVDEAAGRLQDLAAELLERARRRADLAEALSRGADRALLRARLRFQGVAGRLQQQIGRDLGRRREKLDRMSGRIAAAAGGHVARGQGRLAAGAERLGTASRTVLRAADARLVRARRDLGLAALRPLAPAGQRLAALAVQTRLLDPARLLQRGYSITFGPDGNSVRRAADLAPGDRLTTVLDEGRLTSIVQPGAEAGTQRKARTSGGKQEKADTGQKTLFR